MAAERHRFGLMANFVLCKYYKLLYTISVMPVSETNVIFKHKRTTPY